MKKIAVVVIIIVAIPIILGFVLRQNSHGSSSPTTNQSMKMNNSSTNSGTSSGAVQTTSVGIKNFAFSPQVIKIKAGDTVTWTNTDSTKHTVSSDASGEGPNSDLLAQNESYTYTFPKAGTYTYHCTPHPYMKGTVIVE